MMKYPDEVAEQILDLLEQAQPLKGTEPARRARELIRDAARSGYLRGLQDAAGVVRELHDDGPHEDAVLLDAADMIDDIAARSRFEDAARDARRAAGPAAWRKPIG